MKRFFYIAIVATLYLSACSGSSSNKQENSSHTHEDGSTHADHEDHAQEEFSVTQTDSTRHEHMHEAGEEHDH